MRRVVATVLLVLAAATGTAQADTIVFRRGGDVWLMAPDGTRQRLVAAGSYEWPSMADDGTIVALDGTGWLRRLTPAGQLVGSIPTPATVVTDDTPNEAPTHVRVAPDGARIAYDEGVAGDVTTLWTPATATALEFPNQQRGQEALIAPSWIGNGKLLLSRDVTAPDGPSFWLYTVGGGDNSAVAWFSDPGAGWATGLDAAAARNGTRVAVVEDDAADAGGTPTKVVLRVFAPPTLQCEIPLEVADTYSSTSPTFSPDGSRLAFAQSDGIHVVRLDDCAAGQVVTLPGAWEPYWSPFDLTPPASAPAVPKLTLAVSTRRAPRRATVLKHGLTVRVTASAPTTVRFSVRAGSRRVLATTRRFVNAGTRTIHLRVKPAARLVLRVSAAGAEPVTKTIRPR